jgi:hypothetical protein
MPKESSVTFVLRHGCTLLKNPDGWRCWYDEFHYTGPCPTQKEAAALMREAIEEATKKTEESNAKA